MISDGEGACLMGVIADKTRTPSDQSVDTAKLPYVVMNGQELFKHAVPGMAEAVGIDYRFSDLPQTATQKELFDHIKFLNDDHNVHGIMIHKPVPKGIDFQKATNLIDPVKDIEGMNEVNLGQMLLDRTKIIPCTPAAVMALRGCTRAITRRPEPRAMAAAAPRRCRAPSASPR